MKRQANRIRKPKCRLGLEVLEDRRLLVVGGFPSDGWDWMAGVLSRDSIDPNLSQYCGGALIADNAVITAAHCVDGLTVTPRVWLGSSDLNDENGQIHEVDEIVVHEDFTIDGDNLLYNDLAILFLKTPTDQTPIERLTSENADLAAPGQFATVAGWGQTEGGVSPSKLNAATIPIVDSDVAEVSLNRAFGRPILDSSHITAGSSGTDSCGGDSGGPLFVTSDGQDYLAGVISWGIGCARPGFGGVNASIVNAEAWIDDVLASAPPTLEAVPPPSELPARSTTLSVPGNASGVVSENGAASFRFQATAGDIYTISTALVSAPDTVLYIMNADGEIQSSNDNSPFGSNSQLLWVAPEDGSYYAVVTGHNVTQSGQFDISIDVESPLELNLNRPLSGNIAQPFDFNTFQISATEGETYVIETQSGTLDDTILQLVGIENTPNGAELQVLTANDDFGNAFTSRVTWQAPATATYLVDAFAFNDSTGSFSISFETAPVAVDDFGDSVDDAFSISVPNQIQGIVNWNNDRDVFQLELEENSWYSFETSLNNSGLDSVLRLYNSDGYLVAEVDDASDEPLASKLDWFSEDGGVHFLEVASLFGDSSGSYSLDIAVDAIDDDHSNFSEFATPLTIPGAIDGEIERLLDWDRFQFTARRGAVYTFQLGTGSLDPALISILNDEGAILSVSSENFRSGQTLTWTAPADGEFFVEVAPFVFETFSPGAYQLVTSVTQPVIVGDINQDGVVNSTDLGRLLNRFNDTTDEGADAGDLNNDGVINSTDLGLLLNNFGAQTAAATSVQSSLTPSDLDEDEDRESELDPSRDLTQNWESFR